MRLLSRSNPEVVDGVEALSMTGVSLGYGEVIIVRDMDLIVRPGEVVALLGANGAGKTTTIRGCVGLLEPSAGHISIFGSSGRASLYQRARSGVGLVPEERAIIPSLTVAENLRVAGVQTERVTEVFPEIAPLVKRKAGLLSGGEQQILVLGRIFASDPKIIFADELSLGLAPQVVSRLLTAMRTYADRGGSVLLVEQQIRNALSVADRAYVLNRGRIAMEGPSSELRSRVAEIESHYL